MSDDALRYYTPGIPNGWFQVAYVDDLDGSAVLPLKYFGKDLVLFRTESGEISLLDAFCPHLGAHLGHGGKVKGESIECPFHAWQFNTGGQCTAVPYAKHMPRKAELQRYPTRVVAGLVLAWYHAEGKPPEWEVATEVPEWGTVDGVRNEEWTEFERRRWKIKTRNQEMAENQVDSAHFHYVHGTQNMPESNATAEGPIMRVYSGAGMETPRGKVDGSIESLAYGFGVAMVRFKGLAETLVISTTTPIDAEYVDVRFHFSVKKMGGKSITQGVGKAFMDEVCRQLEQDIPIWENKMQWERPLLCDGDGPIALFRRWSKQFYSYPAGAAPSEAAE